MPRVSYPVNRDRSNSMQTERGQRITAALENLYFAIAAAEELAVQEGVFTEQMKTATDLVEQRSIEWFMEVLEQDKVSSMQGLADDIWSSINAARSSALATKASGYINEQPDSVPDKDHYFRSRLEGLLESALNALSDAAGHTELKGRPYVDPVSGETKRYAQYVDAWDSSYSWDPVRYPGGTLNPNRPGFGIAGNPSR